MPSSFSRFPSEEELPDVATLYIESLAALDEDFDAEERTPCSPSCPSTVQALEMAGGVSPASSEAAPPAGDTR